MDHDFYKKLNLILEDQLDSEDLTLETFANPFMHLISEHPVYAHRYQRLYEKWKILTGKASIDEYKNNESSIDRIKKLKKISNIRLNRFTRMSSDELYKIEEAEVVIISVLVDPEKLLVDDDFYFGPLQNFLADNKIRSLMVYLNQSGADACKLKGLTKNQAKTKKIILPATLSLRDELKILGHLLREIYRVRKKSRKTASYFNSLVLNESIRLRNIRETRINLRNYIAIKTICKHANPKLVLTLYEGHVWEKLAWLAAKEVNPDVRCIGYQHSVLRKKAYGIFRSIQKKRYANANPDALLVLGEISRKAIEENLSSDSIPIYVYGSHRKDRDMPTSPWVSIPKRILVTPEGIRSENLSLITFAYRCALEMTNYSFVLRFHPTLPFETLPQRLKEKIINQDNIIVSREPSIKEDFKKAGYLIYRGSSTVLYAIMAGLKPFYLKVPGVADIDPLFSLYLWRDCVNNPMQVQKFVKKFERSKLNNIEIEWMKAVTYCNDYICPLNMTPLLKLVKQPFLKPFGSDRF